jgi:uncharacterized protein with GYD domain
MAKYLFKTRYTTEGLKGVVEGGGSAREEAVRTMVDELGGTVEAFYFACGHADSYVVVELPDNETASAVALTAGASGAIDVETVVLLTPSEVDAAAQKSVDYHGPGK